MNANTKSTTERAQQAQSKQDDLAGELSLTKDELKVVQAFSEMLVNRAENTPTEIFISNAETLVRKRFPNNTEANEQVEPDHIEHNALSWVEKNSLGRVIGSLQYPAPVDNAKTQLNRASTRLAASPGDTSREVSYAKAVGWLAQMQTQKAYKEAFEPIFQALYRVHTGSFYAAPESTENVSTGDECLDALMA